MIFPLQACDKVIASQYNVQGKPVIRNRVTTTSEEVYVKQNASKGWRTFYNTKPAIVSELRDYTSTIIIIMPNM